MGRLSLGSSEFITIISTEIKPFSGGKESRSYHIDAKSGTVLSECSMQGCVNLNGNASEVEEVLVLKRLTHTVRAVEPRTSFERCFCLVLNCVL